MGHQNLLGLMLHFVTLPLLALLLAGERSKLIMMGVFAALVAVALGASRGAIGFVAIGLALLFLLSLARRPTSHKWRSEEHTSELQSLMRISYAVFCLKKKKDNQKSTTRITA